MYLFLSVIINVPDQYSEDICPELRPGRCILSSKWFYFKDISTNRPLSKLIYLCPALMDYFIGEIRDLNLKPSTDYCDGHIIWSILVCRSE
jgi:hypothetical protein